MMIVWPSCGPLRTVEGELAELLVQTPYVLLLGIPGINVVSAADFAGEMGPIQFYTKARAITGRAGLFPSRYQSDEVDRPDGKLVRCANRRFASDHDDRGQSDRVQRPLSRLGEPVATGGKTRAIRVRVADVLPDRLPDGGRTDDIPASELPATGLRSS